MPQSQTPALSRHQEEEETYKSKQAQIEQIYKKHLRLALSSPSDVIAIEVSNPEVLIFFLISPQHMFSLGNKKNIRWILLLSGALFYKKKKKKHSPR